MRSWLRYLEERRRVIALSALIDNVGGAQAADSRVRLHFPDPCRHGEWPEKPQRPWRPVFTAPKSPWMRSLVAPPDYRQLLTSSERLKPPNLTGPFYEEGSLVVRFDYQAIPHHDPITTPGFIVGVPSRARCRFRGPSMRRISHGPRRARFSSRFETRSRSRTQSGHLTVSSVQRRSMKTNSDRDGSAGRGRRLPWRGSPRSSVAHQRFPRAD